MQVQEQAAEDEVEDVVVLSWWQHPVNVIVLVVGAALIAGMVGWLIADSNSDPGGSDVDVGFLQDMRAHHDQAVQMAFMYLALPDTDPRLRVVAREIVLGQGIDIGRMIDGLFVELMAAHHQGGIHMSEFAATEADIAEVRDMAAAMADSQAHEIVELENLVR